jgi:hypothetical protein
MRESPSRRATAITLAALLGLLAGSFVAPSMDTVGLTPEGTEPFLAGEAAIWVAMVGGALLGAAVAALVAHLLLRRTSAPLATIGGALAGTAFSAGLGFGSEAVAIGWTQAFSADPLLGALAGAAIAALFGGALGALLPRVGRAGPTGYGLAILLGALVGGLAGLAGADAGETLADAPLVCPNGYTMNPAVPSGACSAGVPQGIILGVWVGILVGALVAGLSTWLLDRSGALTERAASPEHP